MSPSCYQCKDCGGRGHLAKDCVVGLDLDRSVVQRLEQMYYQKDISTSTGKQQKILPKPSTEVSPHQTSTLTQSNLQTIEDLAVKDQPDIEKQSQQSDIEVQPQHQSIQVESHHQSIQVQPQHQGSREQSQHQGIQVEPHHQSIQVQLQHQGSQEQSQHQGIQIQQHHHGSPIQPIMVQYPHPVANRQTQVANLDEGISGQICSNTSSNLLSTPSGVTTVSDPAPQPIPGMLLQTTLAPTLPVLPPPATEAQFQFDFPLNPDGTPSIENNVSHDIYDTSTSRMSTTQNETIFPLFVDKTLPPGWSRKVKQKTNGFTETKYDVYIIGPMNKHFNSRKEIEEYFIKTQENTLKSKDFDFSPFGKNNTVGLALVSPFVSSCQRLFSNCSQPPPFSRLLTTSVMTSSRTSNETVVGQRKTGRLS